MKNAESTRIAALALLAMLTLTACGGNGAPTQSLAPPAALMGEGPAIRYSGSPEMPGDADAWPEANGIRQKQKTGRRNRRRNPYSFRLIRSPNGKMKEWRWQEK